jgi:hypothetical protein
VSNSPDVGIIAFLHYLNKISKDFYTQPVRKMWKRVLFGLFLAGLAYYVITKFVTDDFTPGNAPEIYEPKSYGEHTVSSGGPSSPNASPVSNMLPDISPQPEAIDPYDTQVESANASEQLRFPERSFSPGIIPKEIDNHVNSGVSGSLANTSQSVQSFSPEFIGNGANFFGEVSAIENDNPNYSAF